MRKIVGLFVIALLVLPCFSSNLLAGDGKVLLEKNCGQCHGITEKAASPNPVAPNLLMTLRSYPAERLQVELAEGIGSRHLDMPQVQFSAEDIEAIQNYLFAKK